VLKFEFEYEWISECDMQAKPLSCFGHRKNLLWYSKLIQRHENLRKSLSKAGCGSSYILDRDTWRSWRLQWMALKTACSTQPPAWISQRTCITVDYFDVSRRRRKTWLEIIIIINWKICWNISIRRWMPCTTLGIATRRSSSIVRCTGMEQLAWIGAVAGISFITALTATGSWFQTIGSGIGIWIGVSCSWRTVSVAVASLLKHTVL